MKRKRSDIAKLLTILTLSSVQINCAAAETLTVSAPALPTVSQLSPPIVMPAGMTIGPISTSVTGTSGDGPESTGAFSAGSLLLRPAATSSPDSATGASPVSSLAPGSSASLVPVPAVAAPASPLSSSASPAATRTTSASDLASSQSAGASSAASEPAKESSPPPPGLGRDSEAEAIEIRNKSRLQQESEFNKSYPSDAPYALVAIKFPAEYAPNFLRNMNRLKTFRHDTLSTLRTYADEQILKSAYYATEFYSYLASRLPEDSVIMEPTRIGFSSAGRVVCNPIRKTVPAVVTVELFSAISPERIRAASVSKKGEDTFAQSINIVADFKKETKNGEISIAGQPVIDAFTKKSGMTLAEYYNTVCNGVEPVRASRIGELSVSTSSLPSADQFCALKTSFECPTRAVMEPERLIDGEGNVPCAEIWKLYDGIVTTALRSEDAEQLKPLMMAGFLQDFDPEMANLLAHGQRIEDATGPTRRKLKLLSRYMENERRQIFSLESCRTEDSLYASELGDSVRAIARSELAFLKHRSASKRRQYATGLIGLSEKRRFDALIDPFALAH